jgi:hypothetical protein
VPRHIPLCTLAANNDPFGGLLLWSYQTAPNRFVPKQTCISFSLSTCAPWQRERERNIYQIINKKRASSGSPPSTSFSQPTTDNGQPRTTTNHHEPPHTHRLNFPPNFMPKNRSSSVSPNATVKCRPQETCEHRTLRMVVTTIGTSRSSKSKSVLSLPPNPN